MHEAQFHEFVVDLNQQEAVLGQEDELCDVCCLMDIQKFLGEEIDGPRGKRLFLGKLLLTAIEVTVAKRHRYSF